MLCSKRENRVSPIRAYLSAGNSTLPLFRSVIGSRARCRESQQMASAKCRDKSKGYLGAPANPGATPMFYADVVESLGSEDGREVACALDELRQSGRLGRDRDGRLLSGGAGEVRHHRHRRRALSRPERGRVSQRTGKFTGNSVNAAGFPTYDRPTGDLNAGLSRKISRAPITGKF